MPKNVSPTVLELDVQRRLSELDIDINSLLAISNLFRVTNTIKHISENRLLKHHKLSFSGFTVLWVLWVWGLKEPKNLAEESGISKGTLTGVTKTLKNLKLISYKKHQKDKRKTLIQLTKKGSRLMDNIFPKYNRFETEISKNLTQKQKSNLIMMLRIMMNTMEDEIEI